MQAIKINCFVTGVGGAFQAEGASTVVGLRWGGVLCSFLVVVLGAVAMGAKSLTAGYLLIASSLMGALLGGPLWPSSWHWRLWWYPAGDSG